MTVTSGKYTVRFDGNGFSSKHLRRIRRNSVSALTKGGAIAKLDEYVDEAQSKAFVRFGGNEQATNTVVFLDMGQYCQFGAQVIKFLASDRNAWTPYGHGAQQCLQKHCQVEINKCLASSNSGFGEIRPNQELGKLEHGIGMTLQVTIKQPVGGDGTSVQVCHYAGGTVNQGFSPSTYDKSPKRLKEIGASVVT